MPKGNPQYRKGRREEYKQRKQLLKEGWPIVIRAAGSHGFFDLIAIHPQLKLIKLIQVKSGESAKSERRKVEALIGEIGISGTYDVEAITN